MDRPVGSPHPLKSTIEGSRGFGYPSSSDRMNATHRRIPAARRENAALGAGQLAALPVNRLVAAYSD